MFSKPATHIFLASGGTATWAADFLLRLESWLGIAGAVIAIVSGLIAIAIQWPKFMECPLMRWFKGKRKRV